MQKAGAAELLRHGSGHELLHARDVFARASIHFDHFANLYEQRNFYDCASRQSRWFTAGTCSITFQTWIGFNDFQFNKVWWSKQR
ncbi:Uncharacterised protein [Kluyvera cryocrescens]|uniref:Uncharacterized protein n=1 Tax=Kluyvera cryocrescens TaxID=580 RepID=A0A485A5F3_KLUCR|nr:Uncharacterised protein [Kluyvera cryocrescens]